VYVAALKVSLNNFLLKLLMTYATYDTLHMHDMPLGNGSLL